MVGYIGKSPTVGNFVKLDSITTSATTTFNLLNGGVAYSPESARVCLVSLNGVIQNPETAFNIVGSTIVFSQALTSDDVIDYILVLGDTLSVGVPSDATVSTAKIVDSAVTTAKINNDAVTVDKLNLVSTGSTPSLEAKGTSGVTEGYIQLNCAENSHGIKLKSPPHSAGANYTLTFPNTDGNVNEFLQTNGSGTLTWAEAGGGITEADQWRLTANQSAGTNAVISSNLERVDTDGFNYLGTGLTNSSGVFSFPSTGYYLIMFTALITAGSSHNEARVILETTTDNSSYDDAVQIGAGDGSGGSTNYSVHGQFIFDVTDTSTHKFRLVTEAMSSSYVNGDTARNQTHFTVIRLGDT